MVGVGFHAGGGSEPQSQAVKLTVEKLLQDLNLGLLTTTFELRVIYIVAMPVVKSDKAVIRIHIEQHTVQRQSCFPGPARYHFSSLDTGLVVIAA